MVQRRIRGSFVTKIWQTAHRCFRAIVSCKTGIRHRYVFLGKYCHANMAHGTQTLQGNCVRKAWHTVQRRFIGIIVTSIWHTAHKSFRAIVSCKRHTVQRRFRRNILTHIWHTAHRRFRAIVSLNPGTRNTDDLGQLCHVNLAHDTESFQGKYCHVNLPQGTQTF